MTYHNFEEINRAYLNEMHSLSFHSLGGNVAPLAFNAYQIYREYTQVLSMGWNLGEEWQCMGCTGYCCVGPIIVTNVEAIYIVCKLLGYSFGQVNSIQPSVDYVQRACPFHVESKCSIYAIRPAGCVRYNSFSQEDCRLYKGQLNNSIDTDLLDAGKLLFDGYLQTLKMFDIEYFYVDFIDSADLVLSGGRL